MIRIPSMFALLVYLAAGATAGEVSFPNTKLADVKGKQADVNLTFNDVSKEVLVDVATRNLVTIPYATIDKMSYEYSKHHRIKQGAVVMVVSLGAGAILMLTSSKSHWFTIEYHDGAARKDLVLRVDKRDFKSVIRTAERQTGKKVELLSHVKGGDLEG